MTRLLIYASPVDHHHPADWHPYRDRLRETLERSAAAASVTAEDDPIFTYGVTLDASLARVNATRPRADEVVLAQWSTIVNYAASVLFVGDGVNPGALRTALRAEPFLKQHEGAYTPASGDCLAYNLYPYDRSDEPQVRATWQIVHCVPDRVYVGPLGLVHDEDGAIDGKRFEVLRWLGHSAPEYFDGKAVFRPRSTKIEEELWDLGARLDGLAVVSENDPRLPAVLESVGSYGNELPLFMGGEDDGGRFPRATISRCHMDDEFVCLYNHPLVTEERLRFLV